MCVCVCARSHFASKAAWREHQTKFEELDGLIAMVSCFHDSVLPAAHVGLFGISPCSEASEKDQDKVEEATIEAIPGSLFLLVRASHLCVAPAGQSKLRSGGLREGSLTLAFLGGCAPCCRFRETRQWMRHFAMSPAYGAFVLSEWWGQGASDEFRRA